MFNYICNMLCSFEQVFSHKSTRIIFYTVVFCFLGCPELIGVTSFCRFLGVGESAYNAFLHFFRSTAWTLPVFIAHWWIFLLSQDVIIKDNGRAVLLGDHTYVPKDGRKMPGVVTLHQESETQTKPSYFRGHSWGAIGVLTGSKNEPFCTPLELRIHQGGIHIGEDLENKDTLGVKIVRMALNFTLRHNMPSVLVLDAFFSGRKRFQSGVFNLLNRVKRASAEIGYQSKKELCRIF